MEACANARIRVDIKSVSNVRAADNDYNDYTVPQVFLQLQLSRYENDDDIRDEQARAVL